MGTLLDLVSGQLYSSLSEQGLCRQPTDPSLPQAGYTEQSLWPYRKQFFSGARGERGSTCCRRGGDPL